MQFRVLGPLEARAGGGEPVVLGGARPRAVLARLLVARGAVVSTDALIHDLYGDSPPPSALSSLHSYVSNLRRAIEPERGPRAKAGVLITRPPGYLVSAENVDALRFEELVSGSEFRAPEETLARLDEALTLWRGAPYEEFGAEHWVVTEAGRLCELRLVAVERRARALLDLGRPHVVIADLDAETVAHPLRERLWWLLALSLYRTGRQAEALAVLRRAAQLLAEQLGLDLSPELRSLERDILHQSDSLEAPASPASLVVSPSPEPEREPAPEPARHGREAELAELMALPARATRAGLALAAVSGEPGIGKTFLLEAFGECCSARLGQLVLWGRCPDAEATPPLWPWAQVLRALEHHCPPPDRQALSGLLDADRPADARAVARWLTAAARTQPLVIVLDDLQWADPASLILLRELLVLVREAALTLVTAFRTGFDGPPARYDLTHLRISGLEPEAVQAMAAGLGVELDAEAARRLTGRTGGNPFFVRECVRQHGRPAGTVPSAVAELVRSRLDAELAEALAVAALIGEEFDPEVVAQVAGREAYDLLDRAARAGLLVSRDGRPAFACELVREALIGDLPPLRRAALHGGLAAALAARPSTDVAVIAHHAVQAGPHGEAVQAGPQGEAVQAGPRGEAVRWATAAAEQAGRRLAYREAATWWGHAVAAHDASGGDPAEHVELLLRHTRALLAAGDHHAASQARAAALRTAYRADADAGLVAGAMTALHTPADAVTRDRAAATRRPLRLVAEA
ncbi:BTAD domain-containing putative transcriptional regulator [Nonomuraea sp. NPDC000554]|uniref:BTAD domain-containing putative transcriptional regulator n=1 Tax=Nonomuraea sp. NPDC000554 TaxID=3154259 RepID=UPI00331E3520